MFVRLYGIAGLLVLQVFEDGVIPCISLSLNILKGLYKIYISYNPFYHYLIVSPEQVLLLVNIVVVRTLRAWLRTALEWTLRTSLPGLGCLCHVF